MAGEPSGAYRGLPQWAARASWSGSPRWRCSSRFSRAYADRALFNSDQFANRAADALRDERLRDVVAAGITDDLVLRADADLLAARPLIEAVASGVVGSDAFTSVFRAGVRDLHRAVFDRDQDTLTLTLTDAATLVRAALGVLRPPLADQIERGRTRRAARQRRRSADRRPAAPGRTGADPGVDPAPGHGAPRPPARSRSHPTAGVRSPTSGIGVAIVGVRGGPRLRARPWRGARPVRRSIGARRGRGGLGRLPGRPAPRRLGARGLGRGRGRVGRLADPPVEIDEPLRRLWRALAREPEAGVGARRASRGAHSRGRGGAGRSRRRPPAAASRSPVRTSSTPGSPRSCASSTGPEREPEPEPAPLPGAGAGSRSWRSPRWSSA